MSDPIRHFRELADQALAAGKPCTLWWLSFCDGSRPEGSQFLGVSIVRGLDPHAVDERVAMASALSESHRQGCNPGGEVQATPLPPVSLELLAAKWLNRLLTKAEAQACDRETAPKARA